MLYPEFWFSFFNQSIKALIVNCQPLRPDASVEFQGCFTFLFSLGDYGQLLFIAIGL